MFCVAQAGWSFGRRSAAVLAKGRCASLIFVWAICVAAALACSAGGEPVEQGVGGGSGFVPREVTGFWPTIEQANAWIYVANDRDDGFLEGRATFGSQSVGQYDAIVTIDGGRWTNESDDGSGYELAGPTVRMHHSEVVKVRVSGPYGETLECGKAKEETSRSVFACLPFDDYQTKKANWQSVFGPESEPVVSGKGVVVTADGIEPVLTCEKILKNQLVFQSLADGAKRMGAVVKQIQAQRTECAADIWDPEIVDASPGVGCWGIEAIGGQPVPSGLTAGDRLTMVQPQSGRSGGNVLVHFATNGSVGIDSLCWMYDGRTETWFEN